MAHATAARPRLTLTLTFTVTLALTRINPAPRPPSPLATALSHGSAIPRGSSTAPWRHRKSARCSAGGEGLSISYGDIPAAALKEGVSVGERGAGRGLRLLLRTYVHNQLVVMWDNVIMHTVAVDDLRTPADDEFAPLHVRLDNRLLQVWWRNRRVVSGFRCPWFTSQPSWRWAIGARDLFSPSPSPNPHPHPAQTLI